MTTNKYIKFIILTVVLTLPILCKADFCFKSFEEDTTVSKAIFVGKVVKIENGKYWYRGLPKTIFTFEVIESFKGLRKRVSYLSLIGPINGCCNEHFAIDSTFLVFAYGDCDDARILWTNDCSNTGLLSQEIDHYKKLGTPIKHEKYDDEYIHYNREQSQIDSLNKRIESLELSFEASLASESNLTTQRNILAILLGLLFLILAVFIKRNKKRNANKT
jgi:hypothetical protein